MLPRPPACRGALQRQLPTTIESIWLSDEILRHEWLRFVGGCRTDRRFGSFVPGPLESRRRMGKRRMAHLSEALPPPLHSIASLWGSFWEVDRSRWQWQAPRDRKSQEEDTNTPEESSHWLKEQRRLIQSVPRVQVPVETDTHKSLSSFRQRIKECQLDELPNICNAFNNLFRHNLSLGLISEGAIVDALEGVSNDLHAAFPNVAATYCLSFYSATWEGLVACTVLRIEQMELTVPRALLKLLSRVQMRSDLGAVAANIITRLSPSQLEGSTRVICSIVVRRVKVWLQDCSADHHSNPCASPVQASTDSGLRSPGQSHIAKTSPRRLRLAAHWSKLRAAAEQQAMEFRDADALVPPEIGRILRHLPQKVMEIVVKQGSQSVVEFHESHKVLPPCIRYSWLLLVSQISCTKLVFLYAWRKLEAAGPLQNQNLMALIVLRYWISQDRITHAGSLERKLRRSMRERGNNGFGAMISLLKQRQSYFWTGQEQLFNMLLDAGQFSTIHHVLLQLKALGVKIPKMLRALIVDIMSEHDHILALRILQQHPSISPEFVPNLVLSLVRDPSIHPHRIWALMKVPTYGEIPRRYRKIPMSPNRAGMTASMVSLIQDMAVAFAQCKGRSPGVILRNVTQCVKHLRRHDVPLSQRLSRTITYASLILRMDHDQLVPEARAEWALRLIRNVEGPKVAETVTMIIDVWNEHKRKNE